MTFLHALTTRPDEQEAAPGRLKSVGSRLQSNEMNAWFNGLQVGIRQLHRIQIGILTSPVSLYIYTLNCSFKADVQTPCTQLSKHLAFRINFPVNIGCYISERLTFMICDAATCREDGKEYSC